MTRFLQPGLLEALSDALSSILAPAMRATAFTAAADIAGHGL
jgi:hypothetical protein